MQELASSSEKLCRIWIQGCKLNKPGTPHHRIVYTLSVSFVTYCYEKLVNYEKISKGKVIHNLTTTFKNSYFSYVLPMCIFRAFYSKLHIFYPKMFA